MRWRGLWLAPTRGARAIPTVALAVNWLVALSLMGLAFWYAFDRLAYHWNWGGVWNYRRKLLDGWATTVWISLASLVLSLLFGVVAALARRSRLVLARCLGSLYVEVVRGTPLLVQLLIFFYVVADAFGLQNRHLTGILILSFFSGAYLSEIIRAGIESVGLTQLETAKALGLDWWQTQRLIVFPQAVRNALPPMAGQLVSLVKDSSLLSVLGIGEFALAAQEVNAFTYSTLECYLPLAVGYLALTLPISFLSRWLERRTRFET